MKKFLKYFFISIAGFLLLLLLAAGFTQTSLFKSWLRDEIVAAVGSPLGGTLTIGSVEGDLFTGIVLNDITVMDEGDPVIAIPRIVIDYSLSGALSGKFHVRSIVIDSPHVKVLQLPDSTWRVISLKGEPTPVQDSTTSAGSAWEVVIDEVRIMAGRGIIVPLDTASKIPRQIEDLDVNASASISEANQLVEVKSLKFRTLSPEVHIEECSLSASFAPRGITLAGVTLRSRTNSLEGHAYVSRNAGSPSSVYVQTTPLDLSEVRAFVPSLTMKISPACRIDARFSADSAHVSGTIVEAEQNIELEGTIARRGATWKLLASTKVEGLDLSKWTGISDIKSSINGNIAIDGSGRSLRDADLRSRFRLNKFRFARRTLDRAAADIHYVRGNINGTFDASGPSGAFGGNFKLEDVYGKQLFVADLRLHRVDLGGVTLDTSMKSDINGHVRASGEGLTTSTVKGAAKVTLGPSRVRGIVLDSLASRARFVGGKLYIDTVVVRSYFSELAGRGSVDTSGRFNFDCAGRLKDVQGFKALFRADTISGSGAIEAHGEGSMEAIEVSARLELSDGKLDGLEFRRISGAANASGPVDNLGARFSLHASGPSYGGVSLDTISVTGSYADSTLTSTSSFAAGDSVSGSISSVVRLAALRSIAIPHASLKLRGVEWSTTDDSASIVTNGDLLAIRSFQLDAGEQSIRVNGELGGERDDSLLIDVKRLNLGGVTPFLHLNRPVEGRLDLHCALSGSPGSPELHGLFHFSDVRYGTRQLGQGKAWIAATDSLLSWNLDAVSAQGGGLISTASIPIHKDPAGGNTAIDSTLPWSISLNADSLDLAKWSAILPKGDSLGGVVSADVRITGTRAAPAARGELTLQEGALSVPRFGVFYRPIALSVTFEDSIIRLARCEIVTDKGRVEMSGALQFPRRMEVPSYLSSNLHIVATKFQASKSDMVTLVLDGTVDCSSGDKGLAFEGKLEIPSSRWYLPAFLRQFQTSTSPAVPMLVRATNSADTIHVEKVTEDADSLRVDIGIPIRGKVDVHIPRGTWVESPKLLAELSGDLAVTVTDSRPAVSGTIEILRGWVQMYGVRLNFKESKITLKEGEELEPDVTIKMEYIFRDEHREKKSLIVDIRGNAKDPEIIFLLEGKEIKQEDALSYMLFGRSTSDINSNQLSDLNNSASQMMEQMTSSLISSKLSSTVGKSLGMDVIELRGTENWTKASLTGGKYFTDQLFVSFEKGFGTYDADETIPEILTVEYEVVKFLFFQLISGTDDRSGVNVMVKLDSGTSP